MADAFAPDLVQRFESLRIDAATFGHRDHVEVAHAMLERYPFMEAARRYADTINTMATNAGAADKFNTTITLAFLGLVAERMASAPDDDWPAFIRRNPDLLDRSILGRWYSRERLGSALARRQFLLPDKALAT